MTVHSTSDRVLIAEDNEINQFVVSAMLDLLGVKHDIVANGTDCLAALETQNYALILTDIAMPGLDGLRATEMIRQGGSPHAGIPIFAMTANAGPEERVAFSCAGFNGVLAKPFTRAELAEILAGVLLPIG
jgi:CheY-like chemotaxis protein